MGEFEPRPNPLMVSYEVPFGGSSGRELLISHSFSVDKASLNIHVILVADFLDRQRRDPRVRVMIGATRFKGGEPDPESPKTENPFFKEFMERVEEMRFIKATH